MGVAIQKRINMNKCKMEEGTVQEVGEEKICEIIDVF